MARPRLLAPSRILRTTPRQVGGGREREWLVQKSKASIAKGSKSFSAASALFGRATRERVWLLYAWCRQCDDITDGQDHGGVLQEQANVEQRVKGIRVLTHRALDGQPTADLAFDAFGQVAMEARIDRQLADDVIDGFALDAKGWRPRTEADMMRYCYHVAGAVGVMMALVMGVSPDDHETLDRACDLGFAFQLNNIARDIYEDDAAGRCYLPVEWLVEEDIPPGQHMKPAYREKLVKLVKRLVDMAESHEAAARYGARALTLRQRWAVLSAANIYGAIGREVRKRGAEAWNSRVHTSAAAKARFVSKGFYQALRRAPEPEKWPRWTRSEVLVAVRMAGPIAPIPMTPLREEDDI
ncbi:phytoene/squalene synthase family protein [Altericroceibacterium endophyticum]|uniref:Phytoene/squalene synthase family protein n=1 Tax=Altericroceibacterium endophyticum TaxID=1808508 RepID=A0A6I4T8J0_9SPHN|nr:phytoene/squalene synthase family protein [Altericroceibacterium endophyticum]MXO66998.1 phytoene/squalene synthase family protein [Altericroceibacterium endophyticum]